MSDETGNQFGEWLRNRIEEWKARNRKGSRVLTDADFAVRADVPTTSLSVWINGRRPPSPENADRLAAVLGLEVYDKLGIPRRVPRKAEPLLRLWKKMGQEPDGQQAQDELMEAAKNILERRKQGSSNRERTV